MNMEQLVCLARGFAQWVYQMGGNIFYLLTKALYSIYNFFSQIANFNLSSDFLSDVATFEGVLIGVAIPVSLQIVTWTADRYKDNEIAKIFTNEVLYKAQYFLFLPNIILAIFLRFIGVSDSFILWFIFLWLIFNIIIFYKFIRLVEAYATEPDKLLLNKLKKNVETLLQ